MGFLVSRCKGLALAALVMGCATLPPRELTEAQMTYRQVSAGPAATAAPDELHKARAALEQAERAFAQDPSGAATRDLAYIAQRKALIADAKARVELANRDKVAAAERTTQAQARLQKQTDSKLESARHQLEESERSRALEAERREADAQIARERAVAQQSAQQLQATEQARVEAERKAQAALADLAKIAAVKEEERGLVMTLPGDILFATGQATLLASAQLKLSQVAEALKDSSQRLAIEGHTDSRGSVSFNDDLSYRRASAVRDFLVSRGIAPERCQVAGYGKSRPVAENRTADGRAQNRRVEIIVEGKRTANR